MSSSACSCEVYSKMKVVEGDLLKLALAGWFDLIIHGCNCQCAMGAGIAKTIKQRFPEAYEADLSTVPGCRGKLGSYSQAVIHRNGTEFITINAYTQFHWIGKGVHADYKAIRSVFNKLKKEFTGKRIGYPLIGAGLAGGDWNIIEEIINEELAGEDHTLVRFVRKQITTTQRSTN